MKAPPIIYADLECLLEKMSTCHNNPKKSSTAKINLHTPSVTHCLQIAHLIQQINKLDFYRGKDYMERFCEDFKEHATKIVNYEKK